MSLLAVPIVAVVALIASLLCLSIFLLYIPRYKAKLAMFVSQYQAQEILINNLQSEHEKMKAAIDKLSKVHDESMTENALVSKQLEHRIRTLQGEITSQQELIAQLQTDQGEDKFYTRAIKLAKRGADIEEIVTECELPPAEVEMLISVYQKKSE
ncbi:hypothetical protein NBRC116592_05550 [Colwellia sp. KU-HH00111]|uniref:DUF2802 domain-containing protein n=1 Tax=Colwellia sp. KU-HH00111 TaxID=3127652 RepID=UPI0031072E54